MLAGRYAANAIATMRRTGICLSVRALTPRVAGLALFVVALSGLETMHVNANDKPIKIVAFGDSLTAGYRLAPKKDFPAQLQAGLRAKGQNVEVINAGVSGDTSAAGLARLDWALPDDADAVIVELGANDALRGIDPLRVRANLDAIMRRLSDRGLPVLIAGMQAQRGLGHYYVETFGTIFPDLAEEYDALLYPFFLDGVALQPDLNLDDGMHPNGKGVGVIVERIMPKVLELIERARSARDERHAG